ncbi:hypothetical protein [Agrobacterium tumefaciens]|uniref:hypothetical protein n=1 Tax=Agrobacterium tumefaciens TaxID=358 RepID=UPI0009760720|nr:hypothetical protein BV900_14955 [Agrobacterium tumefaciens]
MSETLSSATMRATAGYLLDKIIIMRDGDGTPQVAMYVVDGEMQIFRVVYDVEGSIAFRVDHLDAVFFGPGQLEKIAEMKTLADEKWKILNKHFDGVSATWQNIEHLYDHPAQMPG